MFNEIKCPLCKLLYNPNSKIPIILLECHHNICQECLVNLNENICPIHNKPFLIEQSTVNKTLLNLIDFIDSKNFEIINELRNDEDIIYDNNNNNFNNNNNLNLEKNLTNIEKEEKIKLKMELINEYLQIIKGNYSINEKKNILNETKDFIQNEYSQTKEKIHKLIIEKKLINNENNLIKELKKNYIEYNNNLLNQLEKEINFIEEKQKNFKEKIINILNKINFLCEHLSKNFFIISNDCDETTKLCEEILSQINLFNEKNRKILFKIKKICISIEKKQRKIKINYQFNNNNNNNNSINNYESSDEDNNYSSSNKNLETFSNDSLLKRNISIHSFNYKDNSNNSFNNSFSSNPENFNKNEIIKKNKLTKDNIVFIKNKLKNECINCSGYLIGDEGIKKLLEFMIKKNLEKKNILMKKSILETSINNNIINNINNSIINNNNKNEIIYKELKLAGCGITNDGLSYIKSILVVTKNSINSLNLSRNYFDNFSVNYIISIINKNPQLKELKLNENYFTKEGKERIEDYIKKNNNKLKYEI